MAQKKTFKFGVKGQPGEIEVTVQEVVGSRMLIKAVDADGPAISQRWSARQVVTIKTADAPLQVVEQLETGRYYHIVITDRTVDELIAYREGWDTEVTFEDLGGPPTQWRTRIINTRVSQSGKNGFTGNTVDDFFVEFEEAFREVDPALSGVGQTSFIIETAIGPYSAEEFEEFTKEYWKRQLYAQRRWSVTPAGFSLLQSNGGLLEGTFAEMEQYLEDGLTT